MPIDLNETSYPARLVISGRGNYNLSEEEELEIKVGSEGEELKLSVPEGKEWEVVITVNIIECSNG